ncbi:MAG: ribonuclease T2 family protein [Actinomycetota bacterium]
MILLCLATLALVRSHRKATSRDPATFDYYLLSLSWAPNYCAAHPADHSSECRAGNHTAFVLHGLWPSSNRDPMKPMNCGPASAVSAAIVRHMSEYFPSKDLIQHEWAKHGTCSGLIVSRYFAQVEQAYTSVQVPQRYRDLDHEQSIAVHDIERDFARANSAPAEAFRVSCHAGELVGVEVCMDKDLHYQACPRSARECRNDQVTLAAPK